MDEKHKDPELLKPADLDLYFFSNLKKLSCAS